MSQLKPMATSTPVNQPATGPVLKEKQENAGIPRQETPYQLNSKKGAKFGPQRKSPAKENAGKPPRKGSRRSSRVEDEEKAAKRRMLAIEAMKIQEQRRLRMCQQALANELEQLTVSPEGGNCDELIEKKRLEAKKLKEKRVLAVLAEQQLQKKNNVEEKIRSQSGSTPTSSFVIKTRRCLYKPRVLGYESPLSKVPEESVLQELFFNRQIALPHQVIIRYSKDEIRSMNPYGYYFM